MYLGNKNTEENAALLNIEIERTLKTDGRVKSVESMGHNISGNSYNASFKVRSYTLDEAFLFVVSSANNGPLVLTADINDNHMNEN
ncbi:hypothetical protein D3C76_1583440 [compost metagenome]